MNRTFKNLNLFEIGIFVAIINLFSVTFDQLMPLLNKIIIFYITPKFLNSYLIVSTKILSNKNYF